MRTDTHRPSVINPAEYDYVACVYHGPDGMMAVAINLEGRERFRLHREKTGGTYSHHEHGGSCGICGANAFYLAIFWHRPSNTYLHVGQDCADKLEGGWENAFKALRKGIDDFRQARAGKNKAQLTLAAENLSEAWGVYEADYNTIPKHKLDKARTIRDLVGKLVQYGSLSEKQVNFLRSLVGQYAAADARLAEREAQKAAAAPCPAGRVVVQGVILSTKEVDTDFGICTKMFFKADEGFTLWGTLPAALLNVERGVRVEFMATVTPAHNDPKHGFFSRPSKAGPAPAKLSDEELEAAHDAHVNEQEKQVNESLEAQEEEREVSR